MSDPTDREALGRRVRALWVEHDRPGANLAAVLLAVAEQIAREAAAAERERCAAVADAWAGAGYVIAQDCAHGIAAAIRRRGGGGT